jgi:hypothetical protein
MAGHWDRYMFNFFRNYVIIYKGGHPNLHPNQHGGRAPVAPRLHQYFFGIMRIWSQGLMFARQALLPLKPLCLTAYIWYSQYLQL